MLTLECLIPFDQALRLRARADQTLDDVLVQAAVAHFDAEFRRSLRAGHQWFSRVLIGDDGYRVALVLHRTPEEAEQAERDLRQRAETPPLSARTRVMLAEQVVRLRGLAALIQQTTDPENAIALCDVAVDIARQQRLLNVLLSGRRVRAHRLYRAGADTLVVLEDIHPPLGTPEYKPPKTEGGGA